MIMQLNNIVKSFAGNIILNAINIEIKKRERVALVGRNGAGKSTLLKIITSELDIDEGEIHHQRELSIGYLAQHHNLQSGRSIWDEMQTVFTALIDEEKKLVELAEQISEQSENLHGTSEKLIAEYSKRTEQFEANGGYRYESDIKGVLIGLGFTEDDFLLPIANLSGGQKTRIALGKLLLEKPRLLVLDEPTNHLDIQTLTWLENYLVNYDGAIVIVSHDRYFLDKIVTKVYEIAHQRAALYYGSYTEFLKQKAANEALHLKRYEKQQQDIKKTEDFIQRNIARASTTKRAQSRRTQLEKMERIDQPLTDEMKASFSFEIAVTSGKDVLQTENFSYVHSGMDEPLFQPISFSIHRGERIALIGENGIGKTTLLKAIIKEQGHFKYGANVDIGYYAQEQENLNESNTVLEEVWSAFSDKPEQEIRNVLGNFLFTQDDVLKQIHLLSGGEKARVSLAKLMLQHANFLILDEPTNHLDLVSKEILEDALQAFPGTIFFVSHDRYFINKLTDRVFELTKDGLTVFLGNYDYYLEKKDYASQLVKLKESTVEKTAPPTDAALSFAEQKKRQSEERKIAREIERLEKEIEVAEGKLAKLEIEMVQPEILNDHEKLLALSSEADKTREIIDHLFFEWGELQQ